MRSPCVLTLFAAASLAIGVAPAAADPGGGNSGAAHQCKQTSGNHGDCVSAAAHGGTTTASPSAAAQAASPSVASPAAAVAPAAAGKKKGGNSSAAHQCQKGGWKNWRRADQTPFKNTGACVSYAAHGGTLTAPKSAAQLLCESLGGVFAPGSGNRLWLCTYTASNAAFSALSNECFAEAFALPGVIAASFGFVSGNLGGLRTDACDVTR